MPDDDYGPWDDSLGDAFAAMDEARDLDGQRIGLDIVAELDRRPSVETRIERALSRIEQGVYTEPAYDPYNSAAGTCDGQLDAYGRCASRYHSADCMNVIEGSAATSDAEAATAWRNTLLHRTPDPELLGFASPLDGDGDWQADAVLAPLGGSDQAVCEAVLAMLGGEGRSEQPRPVMPEREPLPHVSGVRAALGL